MAKRISSLLDPATGKPYEYDVDLLSQEITTPVMGGVRQIMDGHPAQNLDPAKLASILRRAEQGDAQAQHELAEEIEEKDLHYQGTLGTRKRAVAQLDITVNAVSDTPEDQANADLIRSWLDRDTLEDELIEMLDATGKGFSVTESIWDTTAKIWLPERLERADQRFFEFDPVDGKTLRLKGGPDGKSGLPTALPAFKYVVHYHPAKSGLPIRGGLIRGVAWIYLFKNIALKDWTIFAEIYGQPYRVGKYDKSATEADRRALLSAVRNIGTDAAAIIPSSMMIEFVNGMAAGNFEVYHKLLIYLDDLISKAVLGQTGTTDAKPTGIGSGLGDVHNEVRGDIKRSDAKKLAATINQTLVRWIVDFNYGPPASGAYPRVKIGQSEVFTKEDMEMLESFVGMGGEVEMSVVRDKLGWPDPPEKRADGKPIKLLKAKVAAPQNPAPTGAPPVPPASDVRVPASSASQRPLRGVTGALKIEGASSEVPQSATDAIEAAVAEVSDHWTDITDPMIAAVFDQVGAASSAEDLRQRLLDTINSLDTSAFAEMLGRSTFMARLAGETGVQLRTGGGT